MTKLYDILRPLGLLAFCVIGYFRGGKKFLVLGILVVLVDLILMAALKRSATQSPQPEGKYEQFMKFEAVGLVILLAIAALVH